MLIQVFFCLDSYERLIKMVKPRRSLFWSAFTKTVPNRAKCNYCGKKCSYIGGTTSNLARHLRTAHPEIRLTPQTQYQESEAPTIIITTQTSNDGNCIATIDSFMVPTKTEVPDECEDAIALDDFQEELIESDRKRRSECWLIFKKLDENRVLCSYCCNTLSAPKGATSNLMRHLKLKHPSLYADLQAKEIEKKKSLGPTEYPVTRPHSGKVSKSSTSHFSLSQEVEMPQDMIKVMQDTQQKIGFVPNAIQALSHRPNEMRAFLTYNDTVMEDRLGSHLTKADKEMICIAVSSFNRCKYSIIAHCGLFRNYSHNKILADQIAANWETADLNERQRSILQFAMKVTKCEALMENDFKDLENNRFDSEDAWDIGSIVSFCSLSNRMAFLTNMAPNEEYYSMGREDKSLTSTF